MKDHIRKRIESYRNSDDKRPLIVDVSTIDDLQELSQQYLMVKKKSVFELVESSRELPSIDDIYQFLDSCVENLCFVYGLGTYLRLNGKETFAKIIHSLLGTAFTTKFIIVTYRCGKYFNEKIPKFKDNIIICGDDNSSSLSSLVFISSSYQNQVRAAESGLKSALQRIEKAEGEKIYVVTGFEKSDFPDALIGIEECKTPYDLLCIKDKQIKKLNPQYGFDADWHTLLSKMGNGSLEDTIKEYISVKDILAEIKEWNEKSPFEKWLIFIYLKIKDYKTGNWAVDYSIDKSQSFADFINNIYYSILSLNYNEDGFRSKYDDRKKILKAIRDDSIIYQYCSYVQYKKEESLYYLTDNTDNEKKLIIQIIDQYKEAFSKEKLLKILQSVYNDLYEYLVDYNYGDGFLTEYFNEYKFLKVKNTLTPEFKKIVDSEAIERSFKRRLMCRSEKLDEINITDSRVYFIDALGVEFLSFIEMKCQEKGLACKINICKANLPTITSRNTEFKDYFAKKGIDVIDEKRLDSLKHCGKDDYDFDKTKIPIHIIEEFRIINDCLDDIKKKIERQDIKKAIIISDHGATRLAILNTDMLKEAVESTGEHGGRVCRVVPDIKQIPNAILEEDNYILADYNAFKGGRVGKVEMHGGATLEEVCVPIIEIYGKTNFVEIKVLEEVVKVSFKKKALLHFFCTKKLSNCSIRVNGKAYNAETTDGFNCAVQLDDLKKRGEYKFEVWDNDELISATNSFVIEKESAKTNDIWE